MASSNVPNSKSPVRDRTLATVNDCIMINATSFTMTTKNWELFNFDTFHILHIQYF